MMATPTYDLIEEQVLGSAQASVTFGNGGTLTQAYKDLVLEIVGATSSSGGNPYVQFNSDTGNNYSYTYVGGNGSSATSGRNSNQTQTSNYLGYMSTSQSVVIANLQSYANTSVYKTTVSRGSDSANYAMVFVTLWRSTAAITSFIVNGPSVNFASGTTFRLWGIK